MKDELNVNVIHLLDITQSGYKKVPLCVGDELDTATNKNRMPTANM